MKISIIHPSLNRRGGAERVVIQLVRSLAQQGHEVKLLTRDYSHEFWGEPGRFDFSLFLLKSRKLKSASANRYHYAKQILDQCGQDDLVNPHNYPATYWVALAKTLAGRFPFTVWYCEEPPRGLHKNIIDRHVRMAHPSKSRLFSFGKWRKVVRRRRDIQAISIFDLILANSKFTAGNVETVYGRKAHVCYLGVDNDGIGFQSLDNSRSHRSLPYLLTVTRLEPLKNIETIILALVILRDRNRIKDWKYLLVGEGKEDRRLRQVIKTCGMAAHVEMTGFVPDEELWKIVSYARASISIPLDEPFGLVPLEVGLLKVPSIVSNHGGPVETVISNRTGIHADPLRPEDVAEKIDEMMNDPDKCQRMGEAAFHHVHENFLWKHFMKRFLDYIDRPKDF